MLSSLHIENIAVIKNADIDFSGGFTVLTGETGAGKSIIIDSINLLCGGKPSRELIRSGEESAMVSALFSSLDKRVTAELSELGIPPDEDGLILLSRTITEGGKSTAKVNGRTVPVSLLREGARHLLAIHGQHDNMALLQSEKHIGYLDEFAGAEKELLEYRACYDKFRKMERELASLRENEREKAQRSEFLRYEIKEIEAAKLREGEEEKLEARRRKLQNCEKIAHLSELVYTLIYSNEKGNSATDKIKRAEKAIEALAPVIPDGDAMLSRLDTVLSELADIAEVIETLGEEAGEDPTKELDRVEGRLDEISKLEKKYGDTIGEVLSFLEDARAELDRYENSEERIASITAELESLAPILTEKGEALTRVRREAGERLSKKIVDELSYLDMGGVEFGVSVEVRLTEGKINYNQNGAEEVEFLISTNRGEPKKSLSKIASGGELSRIMLAIKSVLSEEDSPGTLIFDEVDTGISGKTSQKIGIKLRDLAKVRGCQVLSVTHSAQIAAVSDNHYLIEKSERDGRTSTAVVPLDFEGRVHEVARIMGGINITDRIVETAREMINEKI